MANLVLVGEVIRELEQLGGAAFNFGPKYFANLFDADRERFRVAKQLVAGCDLAREIYLENLRLYRDGETTCAWCENSITELRHSRAIGDRLLHLSCAEKFDAEFRDWDAARVEITAAGRSAIAEHVATLEEVA